MSIKRVVRSIDVSPHTVAQIGIAIDVNRTHIGMLYRATAGEPVQVLHLAWNRDLRSEAPTSRCVCWIQPAIDPDRAMAIAALCRRIWKQNGRDQITYSFSRPSSFFDFTGRQIKGPSKVGLTCASFVLAVFDAARLPLVMESDGPLPNATDIDVQRKYLEILKLTPGVSEEDIQGYEAEIGNIRFRPLEVAGAATADTFPAGYRFSCQMARDISNLMGI
jgi:hypothetical protein